MRSMLVTTTAIWASSGFFPSTFSPRVSPEASVPNGAREGAATGDALGEGETEGSGVAGEGGASWNRALREGNAAAKATRATARARPTSSGFLTPDADLSRLRLTPRRPRGWAAEGPRLGSRGAPHALRLMNTEAFWQPIIKGLILVAAVAVDMAGRSSR